MDEDETNMDKKPWEIDEDDEFLSIENDTFEEDLKSDDGSSMRHDLFSRACLMIKRILICLLMNTLDKDIFDYIDFKTLSIEKSNIITDELREFWTDLTISFKVSGYDFKTVIIIEHKSYYDKFMLLQMLTYIVLYWNGELKDGHFSLSRIRPIFIYHGNTKINLEDLLSNMFDPLPDDLPDRLRKALENMSEESPLNFKFKFFDLDKVDLSKLKGSFEFLKFVELLKYSRSGLGEVFDKFIDDLEEHLKTHKLTRTLRSFLISVGRYVSRSKEVTKAQIIRMVKVTKDSNFKKEFEMTAVQEWIKEGEEKGRKEGEEKGRKEGEEKGRKEGREEGEMKKAITIARNMKNAGFEKDQISRLTGLTIEEVEKI